MTFGMKIRALRLGWDASEKHGCQVRIADLSPTTWRVDLWPIDRIVPPRNAVAVYRKLDGCSAEYLDMIPGLASIRRVKHGFAVVVDDDGRIVRTA